MQYFEPVKLTPKQIEFLKTTDFDIGDISSSTGSGSTSDDGIVAPEIFITAAGLDGYEMGNLKIIDNGADVEAIDKSKDIADQDIAMLTSYIKQQVRDTYGVQLQLK